MSTTGAFEVIYSVSGGMPYTSAYLHLLSNGRGELFLGSTWSLPPQELDSVGYFAGNVPAAALANLNQELAAGNFLNSAAATPPALMPDEVTRDLILRQEGREARLALAGREEGTPLAAVEQQLLAIMTGLLAHPVRAAHVTLSADAGQPRVTIGNAGSESLAILLYDPTASGWLLSAELNYEQAIRFLDGMVAWQPVRTSVVPADYLLDLFEANQLRKGAQQLISGESISFSLPAEAQPPSGNDIYLSSTVTFWLTGPGPERQRVVVQTARMAVTP